MGVSASELSGTIAVADYTGNSFHILKPDGEVDAVVKGRPMFGKAQVRRVGAER